MRHGSTFVCRAGGEHGISAGSDTTAPRLLVSSFKKKPVSSDSELTPADTQCFQPADTRAKVCPLMTS